MQEMTGGSATRDGRALDGPRLPLLTAAQAGDQPRAAPGMPLLGWDGPLYCHVPLGTPLDPAIIPAASGPRDRWSQPGEPTAYLASDHAVALGELARHQPPDEPRIARRIVALWPRPGAITGLVDLSDPVVAEALRIPRDRTWHHDIDRARAVAARIRRNPACAGVLTPSLAFPDASDRWNIVLFGERMEHGLTALLRTWMEVARVEAW